MRKCCSMGKIFAKWAPLLFTVFAAAPAVAQQSRLPTNRDMVWTWSKHCDGEHRIGVTVRLGSKVLYRGVLPICRGSRNVENGRADFHFAGGHIFQGEYRTDSTDSIEGEIWQAGGDPGDLILGISFATSKRILLNTVHVARPDKETSSELDNGLFIATDPAPPQ
jgi:hypothetical protein